MNNSFTPYILQDPGIEQPINPNPGIGKLIRDCKRYTGGTMNI